MATLKSILYSDRMLSMGIICILLSVTLLMLSDYFSLVAAFSFFLACYAFSLAYSVCFLIRIFALHRWKMSRGKLDYTMIMLILWLISAFALNKNLNVFYNSSTGLTVCMALAGTAIVLSAFQDAIPIYAKQLLVFLLTGSVLLFAYYTILLVPIYVISLVFIVFFGLSVHTFIPFLLCIATVVVLVRMIRTTPALKYGMVAGIVIPMLIIAVFIAKWNQLNQVVKLAQNHNTLNESQLPEWAVIARELPKSFLTETYLKADLLYATPDEHTDLMSQNISRSLNEPKKHDPLVMIASFVTGRPGLHQEDRIKILKSVYDTRHLAQERLWSGDHLETASVVSNVVLYPEYRMAYTEQTLTIQNNNEQRWRNDEEAIYTFHVPEGAVVSSLSLWINGIEEKARLTTKSKAEAAYTKIVGVEARDPSVVHWQEGNTVSVRVFPCNPEENRKFRIGVTSPLKAIGAQLTYQSTWFEGPTAKNASESLQVGFYNPSDRSNPADDYNPTEEHSQTNPPGNRPKLTDLNQVNVNLKPGKNGKYITDRTDQDKWQLSFAKTELSSESFSFGGSSYHLKEKPKKSEVFSPRTIYLDLNSSWSERELKLLWPQLKARQVYVFDEKMKKVTADNLEEIYRDLSRLNFSLFPFHEIADPENALVISKSQEVAPNLSDLSDSNFQKKTSRFLATAKPFHLYNLGEQNSPYLKTLKQFGAFIYAEGDLDQLKNQLKTQQFETFPEEENILTIAASGMAIEKDTTTIEKTSGKTSETVKNNAPDHLLRLFAYNDILHKTGPLYFEKKQVRNDLIALADQAFIVSPVSSLIVLETKTDYENFGIEESKNSLKNASIPSSGAAPEPHEWMLILLCIAVMAYFGYKSDYLNQFKPLWK